MPSRKIKDKLMKHRICSVARIMACASFLALAIIGVSSLVRAMSLTSVANQKGVPAIWDVASLGNPDSITVPVDYWDQRQDSCDAENRQFEWVICGYWSKGTLQGIVKNKLGTDGLPVPTYTNSADAWNANRDVFTMNVTGHDPVQPGDNFYRWFHEVSGLSKHYSGEATFYKVESSSASNVYKFGRDGTFPLDDVDFSKDDEATEQGHNYHFTSHLNIPIKVAADGQEKFEFSGDDDVWVFLNGQLALDLGGLHEKLNGSFVINTDGTLTTYVQNVNDVSGRAVLGEPSNDFNGYVDPFNKYNTAHYKDVTKTIDLGLEAGDVVNLDVFYAERSTTESNIHITLTNMNWPIAADSDVKAKVVDKVEGSENNLVQFNTSITNRDPSRPLDLERLAAFIREKTGDETKEGYLPLDSTTLKYTKTPEDPDSWQPLEITAPANTAEGFNLVTPLHMTPYGQDGDTIYFRYFGETSGDSGTITSLVSYYTTLDGVTGFTYDYDTVTYTGSEESNTHKVNISYIYADDESQAHDPYSGEYKPGDEFEVPSPIIDGYTADTIKVTGTVEDKDLNYIVRYTKTPENRPEPDPETHTITIHYIYEDGSKAAEDYKKDFHEGDEFEVPSPEIEDYTPDQTVVKDTVGNEDKEYFVRYKTNKVPEGPETPSIVTPPSTSQLPGSDIFDDPLDYTPPLGEVAFVPNTGLVSDLVAPVFEQYFASIILSQGMVLSLLLIFAGSFATYFSLRRYLGFTMAPATATATRSAAKNATKSMTKSPAKTATKTAKAMKTTKAIRKPATTNKTLKSTTRTSATKAATSRKTTAKTTKK